MNRSSKILFICSQNRWRSPTAEKIFRGLPGYLVKSAGTEDKARIKVNEGHVGWADLIFVMEKKHKHRLWEKFQEVLPGKKIVCLHIPDDYEYMNPDLIDLLKARLSEHIEIPG